MDERKRELLNNAIRIIAEDGYASLSMRALARASDMKLGALQYHFRTWEDLLEALADFIHAAYEPFLARLRVDGEPADIVALVTMLMDDEGGKTYLLDRALPQLWAMGRVEPTMGRILKEIYEHYLAELEASLARAGSADPKAEGLLLMSMIEGSTLFVGDGSPWANDDNVVKAALIQFVQNKYGANLSKRGKRQ